MRRTRFVFLMFCMLFVTTCFAGVPVLAEPRESHVPKRLGVTQTTDTADARTWLDLDHDYSCALCEREPAVQMVYFVDDVLDVVTAIEISSNPGLDTQAPSATLITSSTPDLNVRALPFFGKRGYGMRAIARF